MDATQTKGATQAPYVVSADVRLPLTQWAKQHGWNIPDEGFFRELRTEFAVYMEGVFEDFQMLDEHELQEEIVSLLGGNTLPVVSLDSSYWKADYHVQMTRTVQHQDGVWKNLGLHPRSGFPCFEKQIQHIASSVAGEVVLWDDVIFEGKSMEEAVRALQAAGVTVRAVYASVGIQVGITRVSGLVEKVSCAHPYKDVHDEVCERDFYPGVPFSGRSVFGLHNVGAPYIKPFGDAVNWATIPECHTEAFSRFCRAQAVCLFSEIERRSERRLRCCELPRGVHGLPSGNEHFVDLLRSI